MHLRFRLPLYFALVVAIGALSSYLLVRRSAEDAFRSYVYEGDAQKARIYANILSSFHAERKSWEGIQPFLAELPRLVYRMLDERIHGGTQGDPIPSYTYETVRALVADRIVVADLEGLIVADTAGLILGSVHPAMHLAHGVPVIVDLERKGTVLVGSMVDSSLSGMEEKFLGSIARALLIGSAVSGGLALLLGLLLAMGVVRPLASLNAAVRAVASGELGALVAAEGRDEVAELSRSFNAMSLELSRLEEARKRVIADSAHELRTPVALIRGSIEAMMDGVYPLDLPTLASVHEETLRLTRLIDTLRELETIDSGRLDLELEDIDALSMVRKAVALFASAAKEKRIVLALAEPESGAPRIRADWFRLGEVVYNLLSNAIKYVPPGGRVRVSVGTDARGACNIAVDDSGPGIPAAERQRVFERFYRLDASRSSKQGGRGLGLAIAAEIAKAHGGGIAIEDSDLGGSRFILRLPPLAERASG